MAVPTTCDTVTITATTRQRWLLPVLVTALVVMQQLPQWLRHSTDPSINHLDATWRLYWLLTILPLYALALFVRLLPVQVELDETALVLRRPLRRRRLVYWRDIQSIAVDQRGSRRRVVVFGDDPDGRRIVLPVPFTDSLAKDPRFNEKFHLVGQAWLARRGDDWQPLPPPRPSWLPANDAETNSPQP